MNLWHIDEFLEKHSAGWQPLEKHSRGWHPFKGDFRISRSSFRRNPLEDLLGGQSIIGHTYKGISDLGNTFAGIVGYETPEARGDREEKERRARAEAEAAVKQAEFEASRRAGLERLAQKRKKGFGASMIVNPTLGSSSTLGS